MRISSRTTAHNTLLGAILGVTAFLAFGSYAALAEEPTPKFEPAVDPSRIDRDGKKICGFDLMTESEKAGYKNMMHQTKSLTDRDEIRAHHCGQMAKRAKDKGITIQE